ncbi:MAG: tRNA threonylcarbamoyladenosine biosynthesis protein TsaE [Patescibacteria group bacterium]|nr:tRNA threonylcarbamoyladenosine biosynthesis protein TsaE [Patescibacteria group bacterium]
MGYLSKSIEGTKEIGKQLSKSGHRVFVFEGELGSGKTTLIQGFAEGLGVKNITSPTFILMNKYPLKDKRNFCHFDFYRIKNKEEAMFAKDIIFDENNIVCIEWPVKEVIPGNVVKIKMEVVNEDKRKIIIDYGK